MSIRLVSLGEPPAQEDSNDLNEIGSHHHVVRFRTSGQCCGLYISQWAHQTVWPGLPSPNLSRTDIVLPRETDPHP